MWFVQPHRSKGKKKEKRERREFMDLLLRAFIKTFTVSFLPLLNQALFDFSQGWRIVEIKIINLFEKNELLSNIINKKETC